MLLVHSFFFEHHLNGRTFLQFLTNNLPVLLEDIPLNTRRSMWFQMDGAPPHFYREVRQFLDTQFSNRWLGRGGTQNWPARSPDLTSVDFFLWGYIKGMVYNTPPTTPEDMKYRIREAFQNIPPNILTKVGNSFEKRVRLCLEMNGRHFEHKLLEGLLV